MVKPALPRQLHMCIVGYTQAVGNELHHTFEGAKSNPVRFDFSGLFQALMWHLKQQKIATA